MAEGVMSTEIIRPFHVVIDITKQFQNYIYHKSMSAGPELLETRQNGWKRTSHLFH
jgi:hypothetical protein